MKPILVQTEEEYNILIPILVNMGFTWENGRHLKNDILIGATINADEPVVIFAKNLEKKELDWKLSFYFKNEYQTVVNFLQPKTKFDLPAIEAEIDVIVENTTAKQLEELINKRKKHTFAEVTSMLEKEGFYLKGDYFYNKDPDFPYSIKETEGDWIIYCEGYILPSEFGVALIDLTTVMTACELLNSTR